MTSCTNPIAIRFGKNLARQRERSNLSQEALAVLASLHRTEIGLLERGERCPRIDTVVKLAAALNASVDDLIEGITWNPGSVQQGGFGVTPRAETMP
jgi:transcriptional regulator with XRE-family HTH domain